MHVALVTVVAAWLSFVDDASAADLDAVRAAVRMRLSSLSSVQVTYTVEYTPDVPTRDDPSNPPDKREWAEQGPQKRFLREIQETGPQYSFLMTFDGQRAYIFESAPDTQPRLGINAGIDGGYDSDLLPSEPLGMRVRECGKSLADVLDLGSAVLVGGARLFRTECVQIDVASIGAKDLDGRPLDASIFLDVEHNYVPRRIALFRRGLDPTVWQPTWDIDELSYVRDSTGAAAAADVYWVPKRATFRQPGSQHVMEFKEITINERIPPSQFRPNAPPGTIVTDMTAGGKTYFLGGLPAADKFIDHEVDAAREELRQPADRSAGREAPSDRSLSAAPVQDRTLLYTFLAVSSLPIACGVFLMIRRRAFQ